MAEIERIRQKLPFLIDLSKTEPKSLPKMGDRNETFVNKAMDIAEQHPEMFPAGFLKKCAKMRNYPAPSLRFALPSIRCRSNSTTPPLKRAPKLMRQRSRFMR